MNKASLSLFYNSFFYPKNSVLIFSGDLDGKIANDISTKYFGTWKNPKSGKPSKFQVNATPIVPPASIKKDNKPLEFLVVDLPSSGQASVNYLKKLDLGKKSFDKTYVLDVMNSLLGGGYSSRLNQEIRIKRGLSYGAGSSFSWRIYDSNFSTRTQTKNTSAAEVAELVLAEINRLHTNVTEIDLKPRKAVLIGEFGTATETTGGLLSAATDLYIFGIPIDQLNSVISKTNAVSSENVKLFAKDNLSGGEFVIVGNYADFKEDLAKRFPNAKVKVIKADELDISNIDRVK